MERNEHCSSNAECTQFETIESYDQQIRRGGGTETRGTSIS